MNRPRKYGMIRVMSRWTDVVLQIFGAWRVLLGYAVILTVLSAVSGRWSYTCSSGNGGFWCRLAERSDGLSVGMAILWLVCAFCIYCLFAHDFYESILKRRTFRFADIFAVSKQRLKAVGMFLLCLLGILISCAVLLYILNPLHLPMWHTANPDWRIELIYYTGAFIAAAVPLLIMRCAGGLAYYFNEGRIPFRKLYDLTFNRAYVGIFAFLLLSLLCVNLHIGVIRYFSQLGETHNLLVTAVATEFGNNLVMLFYIALFLALFQAEYLVLKEQEEAEDAEITPAEPIAVAQETEAVEPAGKTKKSAKKKKTQRKAKKAKSENGD